MTYKKIKQRPTLNGLITDSRISFPNAGSTDVFSRRCLNRLNNKIQLKLITFNDLQSRYNKYLDNLEPSLTWRKAYAQLWEKNIFHLRLRKKKSFFKIVMLLCNIIINRYASHVFTIRFAIYGKKITKIRK